MKNILGTAIAITAEAFKDRVDKGGKPYMLHCLYVMNKMPIDDQELQAAAVMHDLIEDTDWTFEQLEEAGMPIRVQHLVSIMTHRSEDTYQEYLDKIAECPDAIRIKLADLRHNSNITRLKGLRKKDFKRLEKYQQAYAQLSEALKRSY